MKRDKKRISLCFLLMTALTIALQGAACAQGPEQAGTKGSAALPVLVGMVLAAVITGLVMSFRWKKKQQQYAQQLAAQEQLFSTERLQRQADSVITALSSEYRSVFGADLDHDTLNCYRSDEDARVQAGDCLPYRKWITEYAENFVAEADRPAFIRFTDPENIRDGLAKETCLTHRYLTRRKGEERFEQLRFAAGEHEIGMALSDVDPETRDDLARKNTLNAALAEAEKAGKSDLSFLSRMSHEIRTPMNAIIGLDTLALNDDTLSEKSRDYLMKIGDNAQHLLGLINEILDMSRIKSGQMTLHREEFHFKGMLEQLNSAFTSKCRDKGLSYECRFLSPVDDYYCGDEKKSKKYSPTFWITPSHLPTRRGASLCRWRARRCSMIRQPCSSASRTPTTG